MQDFPQPTGLGNGLSWTAKFTDWEWARYGRFYFLVVLHQGGNVVKQLDHMIAVAGIDHVAIGSDFDGGIAPPKGLEDASMLPALAERLKKRGMSHKDVLKIFSMNALRVLGWRSPAQIQAQLDATKAENEARGAGAKAPKQGP